ncbi:hypothetical protein TcasGA2_TC031816 [Tribolium castaneum]|uniref:Uncharacterized protein n=1 Tax=Tribolium castaneum TaxID=7070 RepID=A0A139WPT4_TRICA|nr:hypothetical protein TcasGA2_TC031816 [Tribolium castaneum]
MTYPKKLTPPLVCLGCSVWSTYIMYSTILPPWFNEFCFGGQADKNHDY